MEIGQLLSVTLMSAVQLRACTDRLAKLSNIVLMYKPVPEDGWRTQLGMLNEDGQIMTIHDSQQLNGGCENKR
jgi:hypothetical protein